jgi:hypothetical protein
MLDRLLRQIVSYHNADAAGRLLVRCLLSALVFIAGCSYYGILEVMR